MREEIHPHDAAAMPEWELEELALEGDFQAQYELEERMPRPSDPPVKNSSYINKKDCPKCDDGTVFFTSEIAACNSCDYSD